jgi:cyclic beta-1,2-glucan synthetase
VNTISDRLELHYLANRDPRIHFAILSDFRDSDTEEHLEDEAVLHAAERQIDRLNRAYPETTFHLFHRRRVWNDLEKTWMGWERKRGKLVEFVKLLKGSRNTSYSTVIGDTSALSGIRYVITLDADTQLPLESAHRMIGAMHLPYNRARLNVSRTRVVEGYGVLQPRIGMTYESTQKSRLAALMLLRYPIRIRIRWDMGFLPAKGSLILTYSMRCWATGSRKIACSATICWRAGF